MSAPLRVLLVDDDVDHAEVVRRTLERHGGYAVDHVVDGPACLTAIVRERYAIVLLDYSLPRMNGLEVLGRLRELGVGVPVVMATGQGDERIAVEAMHAGAIDYVMKTAGYFATLPTVVNKVLKQHELAVDNARLYGESRRQEARLAQIFDSTSDGIVLVDSEGAIVFANRRACELLAVDAATAPGRRLVDVVARACEPGTDAVARLEALFRTPAAGGDGDVEMPAVPRILHWIGQPTDDGEMRGFTITFHDVTREREVSRLKSDFVSFAAHQVRTPLSAIKWMLEVAASEPRLPAAVEASIHDAATSAERLLDMVNDLLDVTRLESEGLQTDKHEAHLETLTHDVLNEVAPQLAEARHRVRLWCAGGVPRVLVDERLLRQAMVNVVSNAIKYTPKDGDISIRVGTEDGWASWVVQDNGIGIPKSAQGRLFEKFYRAENAAAVDTNGRGLGLYMVRLIISRFGGRIHWTSEEGHGTTFGFSLPAGRAV